MEKELTQSEIIARFSKLQQEAYKLGIRVENKNGFDIHYNETLVNHYNSLHEVKIFLTGYKACQIHVAMEKNEN